MTAAWVLATAVGHLEPISFFRPMGKMFRCAGAIRVAHRSFELKTPHLESEGPRREAQSGVVRGDDERQPQPIAPDERRCEMQRVECAERRRQRIARSSQHGRSQEDEVNRFEPLDDYAEAHGCFLGGE